jgi:hypothetical protein
MDSSSMRYQVLENVKKFKTSWIGLGQAFYTVWKDKMYKEWGYSSFDSYVAKEIGIRKQTALKLLRSYYFLEKEEPHLLRKEYSEEAPAVSVPSYESIDALRLAKNKKDITKDDYEQIRKNVFEEGKDARQVKKELTSLIKQREELQPEDAWQKKKLAHLRRLISMMKSVREEIKVSKLLPAKLITDIEKLIGKLELEAK